jgi:hypothetical protein
MVIETAVLRDALREFGQSLLPESPQYEIVTSEEITALAITAQVSA